MKLRKNGVSSLSDCVLKTIILVVSSGITYGYVVDGARPMDSEKCVLVEFIDFDWKHVCYDQN